MTASKAGPTGRPTARERFEAYKTHKALDKNATNFLISLVEAAVFMSQGTEDMFWQEIEQRVAEGEKKV